MSARTPAATLAFAIGLAGLSAGAALGQTVLDQTAETSTYVTPGVAIEDTAQGIEVAPVDVAVTEVSPPVRFTIGAGLGVSPEYPGSDDYSIGPAGTLRFDYIRLPNGMEFGSTGAVGFLSGFGPRGSLRYIPSRDPDDHRELRGLDKVDATLELGGGVGYEAEYWRAFAEVRYGVIGSHAWVGDLGADAILRPNDRLTVNFGPRADWGSGRFMNEYFGISGSESVDSGLNEHSTSAGFYSVGVELGARYEIAPLWGVEGKVAYDRLVGDAGDSPITKMGSANQFAGQIILTRSISLGF